MERHLLRSRISKITHSPPSFIRRPARIFAQPESACWRPALARRPARLYRRRHSERRRQARRAHHQARDRAGLRRQGRRQARVETPHQRPRSRTARSCATARSSHRAGRLPAVVVAEIAVRDRDRRAHRPCRASGTPSQHGEAPKIRILVRLRHAVRRDSAPAPGVGARVLIKTGSRSAPTAARGTRLWRPRHQDSRSSAGGQRARRSIAALENGRRHCALPIDKKNARPRAHHRGACPAAPRKAISSRSRCRRSGASGCQVAQVKERLGSLASEKAVSLIAIHAHGIPDVFPREVLHEAEAARPATLDGPRGLAQGAAGHHRSDRRQGSRRRGVRAARHRPEQSRRLHHRRRDRRCGPLRAPRLRARPRGAGAWQLNLLPRPRRADAAGAHLQRPVLAASRRGPRRARGPHGDRRRRPQALARLPSRADALVRTPALRAGPGRDRRPSGRHHRAVTGAGAAPALCRLRRAQARPRGARPARSRLAGAQAAAQARRHARPGDHAGAARRPPADRGVHDPRQRGRGRDARARPHRR